ncbi:unspecific monooxygenase [Aeromicrobium marinum DSM 15272]|uniref:Unspecific monooxygenase n=1 Tax=Aeromicrobium marinum DSM 15272 TaxID=585531 RepID=E2SBJ2_9ACTN|nr:cytochrome P450 [Aeromicrobium marinum]EFQ83738.1 unspecific monooxygenase [Aeromicrobium marinum DSM 15272]
MRNDWSGQTFPHPPGRLRFVGDVRSVDPSRPLMSMLQHARTLGEIFEFQVFDQKFVFVAGARLGAELCDESRFGKDLPPALTSLREFAGDGLFTAFTEERNWGLAHDLLRPAFTRPAMQSYHPIMVETLDELFAYWDHQEGPVDVSRDMTKLTMETLSRAAFSKDFGSFTSTEVHPFVPAMISALRTAQRLATLDTAPGGALIKRRLRRRNAPHQAYVDDLIDGVVAERRAGPASDHDLLGIMLQTPHPETGERLDDLNIRFQILTFLVAGHETTSGALSFALYYLARHPEILARAQAETDEILGPDPDAVPEFEQVAKFRYLRRVLDEALRLWPTAPAFGRGPREEVTLSSGHTMRPGDWAIVMLPAMHRDPEVWGEDAEEFDPDRFLPERSRARPAHTYKPFGTGERACIGRQFALHESILVLARLLHRYDLSGDPGYVLDVSERLTIMPEGFELTLTPRTPAALTGGPAEDDQEPSEVPPSESTCQAGLNAISQTCPSGSDT